jgi:hypothetical protein
MRRGTGVGFLCPGAEILLAEVAKIKLTAKDLSKLLAR